MQLSTPGNFVRRKLEPSRFASFADISLGSDVQILSPIENLRGKSSGVSLAELQEAIVFWAAKEFGDSEFVKAQEEFVQLTAKVFYDDAFFHQWTSYFLDYFCFQRPLHGPDDLTPYQHFMNSNLFTSQAFAPQVGLQFADLEKYRHSVFKVLRKYKKNLLVLDLFDKKKIEITGADEQQFLAMIKGSNLQGFVFHLGEFAYLSLGMIIHPKEVVRIIQKSAKKAQGNAKTELAILGSLAKSYITAKRLPKVDIKKLYQI